MGAIITIFLSFLSQLPGVLGDYFKNKQKIQEIKLETDRLIAVKTQELAAIIAKAEAEKAATLLRSTSAKFKYVTFFMWFAPFILTLVYPPYGTLIFDRLAMMPPFYAESVVYLMMVVWGAQISQPVVSGIFEGLRQFFREKRIIKAAMSPNVDNEALFNVIRTLSPGGKLSQDQVDAVNEVLRQ